MKRQTIKYEGSLAWCKVINDDNTYTGRRPCTYEEFSEYLHRWLEVHGLDRLIPYDMVSKGITQYPVYVRN